MPHFATIREMCESVAATLETSLSGVKQERSRYDGIRNFADVLRQLVEQAVLLGETIFYRRQERSLERCEVPIAIFCDWPQLFQAGALGAGNAFPGKDCLDAVFDPSK
jgi:hypothetical protein